jgi:hypothetical protein
VAVIEQQNIKISLGYSLPSFYPGLASAISLKQGERSAAITLAINRNF